MKAQGHPGWWAFVVHRVSGVALALFLPMHFWALGQALGDAAKLESFLRWTDRPLFHFGVWGLVMLLAAHLAGGLRVLALEFLPWREWHKTLAALGAGFALAAGLAYALVL